MDEDIPGVDGDVQGAGTDCLDVDVLDVDVRLSGMEMVLELEQELVLDNLDVDMVEDNLVVHNNLVWFQHIPDSRYSGL